MYRVDIRHLRPEARYPIPETFFAIVTALTPNLDNHLTNARQGRDNRRSRPDLISSQELGGRASNPLYYTAGPNDESEGLFGMLVPVGGGPER